MKAQRSTSIEATPDEIWAVLADFGALAVWAPVAQHSCLLGGPTEGVGLARRVQIARQTLIERVTVWEPGRELSYTIEGLPPIVGPTSNTWRIGGSGDHTDVSLTTEIDTGVNPLKLAAANRALARLTTGSETMLMGLRAEVAGRAERAQHQSPSVLGDDPSASPLRQRGGNVGLVDGERSI